jgi:hypothetical protein
LAKRQGLASAGPDGLLKQFTRTVPETALDEEMSEHPDHPKHEKTKVFWFNCFLWFWSGSFFGFGRGAC